MISVYTPLFFLFIHLSPVWALGMFKPIFFSSGISFPFELQANFLLTLLFSFCALLSHLGHLAIILFTPLSSLHALSHSFGPLGQPSRHISLFFFSSRTLSPIWAIQPVFLAHLYLSFGPPCQPSSHTIVFFSFTPPTLMGY